MGASDPVGLAQIEQQRVHLLHLYKGVTQGGEKRWQPFIGGGSAQEASWQNPSVITLITVYSCRMMARGIID